MPRIELWMSLLAGVAGGLAGVLWSSLVTAPWLAAGRTSSGGRPPGETTVLLFADAALRGAAGAALGFLFWLGWGLIAVVGSPWYATGLLFGALCWAAIAAPVLTTLLLHGRAEARPVVAHALDWLVTCVGIGLLCALAWHRYA